MSQGAIGEAARQLPLPFAETERFEEADFLAAPSNAAARAWLDQEGEWPERRLWLWGEGGCGKSHLLHLWARRTGAVVLRGPALRGLPGLSAAAVAVDDADALAEEQALLHLLNAAAEARLPVLLAGRSPPGRWAVRLPDLASRLRATSAVGIGPAEDELLLTLLARLAAGRQLALPNGLAPWLLARLARTPATLREAIARLDRASLASGGRVTRSLAAAALADLLVSAPPTGAAPALSPPGPMLL